MLNSKLKLMLAGVAVVSLQLGLVACGKDDSSTTTDNNVTPAIQNQQAQQNWQYGNGVNPYNNQLNNPNGNQAFPGGYYGNGFVPPLGVNPNFNIGYGNFGVSPIAYRWAGGYYAPVNPYFNGYALPNIWYNGGAYGFAGAGAYSAYGGFYFRF